MRELSKEDCIRGTEEAQLNTWGNRNSSVLPSFEMNGANLIVSGGGETISLNKFDEIILTIIVKILLCPIWLVKYFYKVQSGGILFDESSIDDKINSLVKMGLVWKQGEVTGVYIRPTYALFELFGEPKKRFEDIPFNTLTHTICEAKVMFEIMTGISDVCKREREEVGFLTPFFSELGFPNGEELGTNVLVEDDFRNPNQFYWKNVGLLDDVNRKIEDQIKSGAAITEELKDFRNFVLIKKVDSTGNVKKDYKFHIPDLIIPQPRNNGKPRSIAIEIELTNKGYTAYEETMERYKDNNRYGAVYWLCRNMTIANNLRIAFKNIGGCGKTRMILSAFKVPTPNE